MPDEADAAYFVGAIMECRRLARNPLGYTAGVNRSSIAPSYSYGEINRAKGSDSDEMLGKDN